MIAKALSPIDNRAVKVGGLLGQRIEMTWRNNLLAIDWDRDFLAPFVARDRNPGDYIGLGKSLDGLIRLAAHTGEERLLAKRQSILNTLLSTQEADGYLGMYQKEGRGATCWDAHEQAYLLMALVVDWQMFHDERSLAAARLLGAWLRSHLNAGTLPSVGQRRPWMDRDPISPHLVLIGYDRALLALYRATGDQAILDYCVDAVQVPRWNQPIVEEMHGDRQSVMVLRHGGGRQ